MLLLILSLQTQASVQPTNTSFITVKSSDTGPSVLAAITKKIQPGLYRGVSPRGESCAVSIELQARFWNNHPAISVLVMNEKALGPNGKVLQMNAVARFVLAENHGLFKNVKKMQSDQALEIQLDKKSNAVNEAPSHMGLKIENLHQGLLIEAQESTQNFFNKTKKVSCYLE